MSSAGFQRDANCFCHEPINAPCQPFPLGSSGRPVISGNGTYAAWSSCAADLPGIPESTDLVMGDDEGMPDAFRLDNTTDEVLRASQGVDATGGDSWNATTAAAISGDGHSPAYTSYSSNVVPDGAFDLDEVFVWRD